MDLPPVSLVVLVPPLFQEGVSSMTFYNNTSSAEETSACHVDFCDYRIPKNDSRECDAFANSLIDDDDNQDVDTLVWAQHYILQKIKRAKAAAVEEEETDHNNNNNNNNVRNNNNNNNLRNNNHHYNDTTQPGHVEELQLSPSSNRKDLNHSLFVDEEFIEQQHRILHDIQEANRTIRQNSCVPNEIEIPVAVRSAAATAAETKEPSSSPHSLPKNALQKQQLTEKDARAVVSNTIAFRPIPRSMPRQSSSSVSLHQKRLAELTFHPIPRVRSRAAHPKRPMD